MSKDNQKTEEQFRSAMAECRSLFAKKLHDYGPSWRILRPSSLTDQLFIKAKRIRRPGDKERVARGAKAYAPNS